jgi:gas vesicle protein
MSEPAWMSYVGMATGVVGAITGIAGAIMGYVSYRRSNSLKSLDLRIELKRALNVAQASVQKLDSLIDYANKSREGVASATGRFKSGMMQKWKEEVEEDKNNVKLLRQNTPETNKSYTNNSPKELESELVEVHRLQIQIDAVRSKYEAAVRADDEERKHIRKDVRAHHASKT